MAGSQKYLDELQQLKLVLQQRHTPDTLVEEIAELLTSPYLLSGIADDERYVWVSNGVKKALGWEPKDMVGRLWIDFVHDPDRDATIAATERLKKSYIPGNFVNRVKTVDGRSRQMLWISTRYREGRTFFLGVPLDLCPETICPLRLIQEQ